MDELTELSYDTMNRYFDMLPKTGYVNNFEVNKVLMLLFLQEFVEEFKWYFNLQSYDIILKLIICLSDNTCIIPLLQCKEVASIFTNYLGNTPVRITEITDLRDTLKINLRLINQL